MRDFKSALKFFEKEKFSQLMTDDGLYFLILRSMSRKEFLEKLLIKNELSARDIPSNKLLQFVYDKNIPLASIEACIREIYLAERSARKKKEENLISELYKLNIFDWGGLHQNSLEKTIIDNYVKKITSFNTINDKIDNELHASLRGYVLCSWYNHWTSIIIEDIFKDHSRVLPTVGRIKKVDFFINKIPFDLKVTYFPEGYVSDKRKTTGLRPEATELKRVARMHKVHFNDKTSAAGLLEDLWKKISDHPSEEAKACIGTLIEYRNKLVEKTKQDPTELIKWLYENQGTRRFDSSNRLFLILRDNTNHFDSWKLKRAKPLLLKTISRYLDNLPTKSVGKTIEFNWEGGKYQAISDAIFVTK